ncbi:MAG: BtpA/SgcQ family protein [Chloroflexota bacterium]
MEPLTELFGTAQPIIAMAHFPRLPGTPLYDEQGGVDAIIEAMRTDLAAPSSTAAWTPSCSATRAHRPYQLKAPPEAIAVMSRVVAELHSTDRPYGVDFLWDPTAVVAVAVATGAAFIRET